MARVPLTPRLTCDQNASRPGPNVETTPMPVMAIRGRIALYTRRMLLAAWGGAALFLASLSCFGWFYLVRLGDAHPVSADAVLSAAAIDITLFTVFALHHSVFARIGARAWVARVVPDGLERSCYVWIASLLFLAVCLSWRPLPGIVWEVRGPATWLCYGVQLAGAVLTLRSASRIDIWELAGVRQARAAVSSPSTGPQPKQSPDSAAAAGASNLEIGGPYRWVRHPIYFGWVLMVFGTPAMTAGRLLFASISTLYLALAIPFEERSLTAEFGAAYSAYQRKVRWRLLPGVW